MAAGCVVPILVFCSAGHFAAQRRMPVGDESVYALDAPLSAGGGNAGGQFQRAGGGTADTAPLLRLCAAAGVGGERLCRRADVAADAGRDFLHGGRRGSADCRTMAGRGGRSGFGCGAAPDSRCCRAGNQNLPPARAVWLGAAGGDCRNDAVQPSYSVWPRQKEGARGNALHPSDRLSAPLCARCALCSA